MRGLALALADAGLTVELPLLPGRGTESPTCSRPAGRTGRMRPRRPTPSSGADDSSWSSGCRWAVSSAYGSPSGTPRSRPLPSSTRSSRPPTPARYALIESMIENGEEVAPESGPTSQWRVQWSPPTPASRCRRTLAVRRGGRGRGRPGVGQLPRPRLHQPAGPRGRPRVERSARGPGQGSGGAGEARAQLPRRHAGLRQGRDRGAARSSSSPACCRRRSGREPGRRGGARPRHAESGRRGHVARLARLDLRDDEVELFTAQLRTVLDHAADVAALDLAHLEPSSHPIALHNVLRPDEPRPSLDRDEVLAVAPDVEDHQFRVPRIGGEAP